VVLRGKTVPGEDVSEGKAWKRNLTPRRKRGVKFAMEEVGRNNEAEHWTRNSRGSVHSRLIFERENILLQKIGGETRKRKGEE